MEGNLEDDWETEDLRKLNEYGLDYEGKNRN